MSHELDAANEYPQSLGRGTGMTQKEFRERLNAYIQKKNIPSLPPLGIKRAAPEHRHAPQFLSGTVSPEARMTSSDPWRAL